MIIYDVRCAAGHRFEALLPSRDAANPSCECGEPTRRMPSAGHQIGNASPGPSRSDMPNTWRGIRGGDPALVTGWHKAMTRREKLEENYPELAGDRRPVLAHEGLFAAQPLRAGDLGANQIAQATFSAKTKEQG